MVFDGCFQGAAKTHQTAAQAEGLDLEGLDQIAEGRWR